jgi:hypothetical protein
MEAFLKCLAKDNYLAVAHYQTAACHFYCGNLQDAIGYYSTTLDLLRGHDLIDYKQLRLECKLTRSAVIFNRASICCLANMRDKAVLDSKDKSLTDTEEEKILLQMIDSKVSYNSINY